jgi:hypothetical protein
MQSCLALQSSTVLDFLPDRIKTLIYQQRSKEMAITAEMAETAVL